MCGIWFYLRLKNHGDCIEAAAASEAIKKRGPDRTVTKYFTFGHFEMHLSFHRLAIMDLSPLGDQPFTLTNARGDHIVLMCNGEIYGHRHLVAEFGLGDTLVSQSDCEVLIHLYDRLGLEGLYNVLSRRADVSGEFALVILHFSADQQTLQVHYMRDFGGKRPLYVGEYHAMDLNARCLNARCLNALCLTSQLCGVPLKDDPFKKVEQVPASTYGTYVIKVAESHIGAGTRCTERLEDIPITIFDEAEATAKIYETFMQIISDQMVTDRGEVAFMVSGGLDSSACACAGAYILKQRAKEEQEKEKEKTKIKTICIGLEGGTDEAYARMVAAHIDSDHMHILCAEEEFIACAEHDITHVIESYDITSNRASVPQLVSARKIASLTESKVVIVGDYADEVCGGYRETKYAPTTEAFAQRIHELTNEIIYFDGARVDRCLAGCGLEPRLPFGDHRFIRLYLSIAPALRQPTPQRCEKYLFRKAFAGKGIIPEAVLWRPKEAFSDGVSALKRSWYQIALDYFDQKYTAAQLEEAQAQFPLNTPYTKESLHYRLKFNEKYSDTMASVLPHFWLPKWGNVREPSARVLQAF
jgi:asparagine synthase (glutamine-hydrolysing)